ncbi:MAG: TonB-dependent receptor [Sphingobium sp.]|nr:TonB-dependent receptor [Sphingobium sp.]MCP5398992.1 TonB-dependent receptor [Sphingomonas sp.]
MASPLSIARLLLLSSALVSPTIMTGVASAQEVPAQDDMASTDADQPAPDAAAEEQTFSDDQVSIPGSIIVTGRRNANVQKSAPAVVSVLSTADIQRTGEGDIAGALSRVTGLSVVGNGFVYVRGLGDRYSLALLNGSPLPSPEPLKRVVPLDLFPTNIVASSLVQKSYSVNFPGEFGGGVINLTTQSTPKEDFISIKGGIGGNSETTGQLGYTYYGSKTDWTGFDNGNRDFSPALQAFLDSGEAVSDFSAASQVVTGRNALLQRNNDIPANFSAELTAGKKFDLGAGELGIIATAGFSNKWRTRQTLNQFAKGNDLSTAVTDFVKVTTDNRIVVNGMLGVGFESGQNKIRWTNLYVRDTLKQASLSSGKRLANTPGFDFLKQSTAWYERQLIDTQLVGEFDLDGLSVDLRAGYANSQREAPYELDFEYVRRNDNTQFGDFFVNALDNQTGGANVKFSDLDEDLYSFGIDIGYEIFPGTALSAGYALSDTKRISSARSFAFRPSGSNNPASRCGTSGGDFEDAALLFRPDYLLSPAVVECYDIQLTEGTQGDPLIAAKLNIDAGYARVQSELTYGLDLDIGVRYEKAEQLVYPLPLGSRQASGTSSTTLNNDYWLPAATLTYEINPQMQARISASKTIARPQFRELLNQSFYDPESNRTFRGNSYLNDSELFNAEARFEWYFARDQRFSLSGFYKKIDNPIETFAFDQGDGEPITSFANAPEAMLYGAEVELQKYFDLSGAGGLFSTRRAVVVANYTYTKSELKVSASDTTLPYYNNGNPELASFFFKDGLPLTGQSDHLVNLQLGLEDTENMSQQTLLITYASKRATSRGLPGQPDIFEYPGFNLDFVVRQGFTVKGVNAELKLEGRNLTGRKYEEYQEAGATRVYFNRYKMGTSFSASLSVKF